ncbi:putative cytochrome c oxidase subunit VIa [Xylona heveae TC161]|uniref:Cytochrome c oxidase subunit 13, mitochondrial n=1 Tax=Xylona heveae (strain CBS 132557 / TC161) TaxID=1328760 RepID=A0A165AHR7_XYLHT|nr:putative cytochrome c oxidase subunit VIa [Xylona heveae TC161]KZF20495.1 putative cytochrome c oxidase subunit VIa [Xylona heveae TC161]
MFPQRTLLRASQRAGQQLRAPVMRSTIQRRFESTSFRGPQDNAFNRERAAVKQHAAQSSELWRKLSIYATIPCLIIAGVNAYNLWNEHWAHWAHEPPLEERTEYPYQNMRTKNFFWGDGDKTLFWNDNVNYHKRDE